MAETITWATCKYFCASNQLSFSLEGTGIVFAAFLALSAFFIFRMILQRNQALKDKIGEGRCERILLGFVIMTWFLLIAFMVYFEFFYTPGQIDMAVSELSKSALPGIDWAV